MNVGESVKKWREARRLSVAELAERSGVSRPYIWQIESAKRPNPSGDVLQRLARGLGVTVADLLGAPQGVTDADLEQVPPSLQTFARTRGKTLGLRKDDLAVLSQIHYRGRRPEHPEDWELIFMLLKRLLGQNR